MYLYAMLSTKSSERHSRVPIYSTYKKSTRNILGFMHWRISNISLKAIGLDWRKPNYTPYLLLRPIEHFAGIKI